MNVIITYCSPEYSVRYARDIAIMARSCAMHCADAAKFVLTNGMLNPTRDLFAECGFVEWTVPKPPRKPRWDRVDQGMTYVRWAACIELLSDSCWQKVLTLDARDIVIQRDPFAELESGLTLCGDGFKIGSHHWCRQDQAREGSDYADKELINGATFGGDVESVIEWLSILNNEVQRSTSKCSDQAIVNHLFRALAHGKNWRVTDHTKDALYYCGFPTTQVRGHKTTAKWIDGQVCMNGVPFCIHHQWDRSIWAREIRAGVPALAVVG